MVLLPVQLLFNTWSRQTERTAGRTCPSTAVSPLAADPDEAAHRAHEAYIYPHNRAATEVNKLKRQVLATTLLTWFQGRMSSITFHHALACLNLVLRLTGGPSVS